MTQLRSSQIDRFLRDFYKTPEGSSPFIIGVNPDTVHIGVSCWSNKKTVITKYMITAIENVFGLHFDYVEPAEATVAIAVFLR